VVHLAAPVQPERTQADANLAAAIVGGTRQVAASCLAAGTRLLVTGTCDEYGDGPAPFVEGQQPQPISPYSEAKAQATFEVLDQIQHQGLLATVVRPFLTYGPDQRGPRLVPSAINAALSRTPFSMTDGTQTREFTHVDDMAQALLSACAPEAVGLLLNLGSGDEHAVQHVVQRIFALCGAPLSLVQAGRLPRRKGEVERFVGDHRQARAVLSFRPRISLEAGLQDTIDARRRHAAAAG
jgi:nucleoside-diphosphate-sugar epimerase